MLVTHSAINGSHLRLVVFDSLRSDAISLRFNVRRFIGGFMLPHVDTIFNGSQFIANLLRLLKTLKFTYVYTTSIHCSPSLHTPRLR